MGKEIQNKSAYVFKSMLQIILNGEESVKQVAKSINGFLFYSIPQQGNVTIGSTITGGPDTVRLTAGDGVTIDKILELIERDFSTEIKFYLGKDRVVSLSRYQRTRFEITVFEEN